MANPSAPVPKLTIPTVTPSQPPPPGIPTGTLHRLAPFLAGFERAIATLQGGVPATWSDRERGARVLAESIPRITVARLIAYGRETKEDVEIIAAKVLTDMFSTEPGLLELTPEEVAEEGAALMQSMWPQAAFIPRRPPEPTPDMGHPVLVKLAKLASQWHRLSLIPIEQAKAKGPSQWRQKTLNEIAFAKREGLAAGLSRKAIMAALESAGDRWVWEIPPPSKEYFLDEFGQAPEGMEAQVPA